MRAAVDIFFFLAVFGLLLMAYKDLKTNKIDSRRNWTIQGAILAMVLITDLNFITYVGLIFVTALFNSLVLKKVFADGDREIIQWALPGLALFAGFLYAAVFLTVIGIYHAGVILVSKYLFKEVLEKRPGVPIIAAAFFLVAIVFYFF